MTLDRVIDLSFAFSILFGICAIFSLAVRGFTEIPLVVFLILLIASGTVELVSVAIAFIRG